MTMTITITIIMNITITIPIATAYCYTLLRELLESGHYNTARFPRSFFLSLFTIYMYFSFFSPSFHRSFSPSLLPSFSFCSTLLFPRHNLESGHVGRSPSQLCIYVYGEREREMYIYIYIYIQLYMYREREVYIYIYINTWIAEGPCAYATLPHEWDDFSWRWGLISYGVDITPSPPIKSFPIKSP